MKMLLKKKIKTKKKGTKSVKTPERELIVTVRSIFRAEVPDTILLGEVRTALSSPKRRDLFRNRLIRILFRKGKATRGVARLFAETKPLWMSDLAHLRFKKLVRKLKKEE